MFKFILVFLLLPATSFGATIILEKHVTSGDVPPQDSFVKDCQIYREGYMEAITINGDGTAIGFSTQVSDVQVNAIRVLNRIARKGTITESDVPCGNGETIVNGRIGGLIVELETTPECGPRRLNTSVAASILRNMAQSICQF